MECPNCNFQHSEPEVQFCYKCGFLIIDKAKYVTFYQRHDGDTRDLGISISQALRLIDTQPTEEEIDDNFIGFIKTYPMQQSNSLDIQKTIGQ